MRVSTPHALEIDDGLGEYRKGRRQRAMRAGFEPLALGDGDLIVDPAELRIPLPGICIFGRDVHPRADSRRLQNIAFATGRLRRSA